MNDFIRDNPLDGENANNELAQRIGFFINSKEEPVELAQQDLCQHISRQPIARYPKPRGRLTKTPEGKWTGGSKRKRRKGTKRKGRKRTKGRR